ncbi:hypothetical protein [Desulfosarcina cetonica]|nr:hypothetical protein [Desulfosarcina cetonica]
MTQPLGRYFDFPTVFGKKAQALVARRHHDSADNFLGVNIFYDFT